MECRTLSSRITSKEGSSKVMVSGGTDVRYVSNGLITLGHTPSAREGGVNRNAEMKHRQDYLVNILQFFLFLPCHSSSCFLALRGEVFVGAVWARPLFPLTASLLPSSSSLTGLYLGGGGISISETIYAQFQSVKGGYCTED